MDDIYASALMAYPIQRSLFKNSKYSLQLFIPPVETVYYTNKYQVSPNACLFLSLPWRKEDTADSARSFKITMGNKRRVLRTFAEAINWFNTINDLFVKKDNVLYFNTDYNHLKCVYAPKYYENPQAIKIVPTTIEVGQGVMNEGVVIYINRLENYMMLLKEELQDLFDILDQFNFASEVLVTYKALEMSLRTNNMTSYEKWAQKFRE